MNNNNNNPHLGVNKLGRNIRKSPLHQPNFPSSARPPHQQQQQPPPPPQPQPQPLVYNISKNEFRSIVQQLTGTPSRSEPSPPPPYPRPPTAAASNYKQPPSNRLQRIRPPPLAPIARPPPPLPNPAQNIRLHSPLFTPSPASNPFWAPAAESPVSAYMRYLENSIVNQPPQQGILPTPPPNPAPLTPQGLPSPLPSPSAFLNLLSPRSPHPLISPNFQFPPQLSPGLLGSPFPQAAGSGILGPGPQQPPLSPGLFSPSSFLLSPRWRNM